MTKTCLCITQALAAAIWGLTLAPAASAQAALQSPALNSALTSTQAATAGGYFCVDPREAGARRIWQPGACELPLVTWPLTVDAASADPRRLETFQRAPSSLEGVPGGFSRLPWHGYPRHSAPSEFFWR